jgi:hypothetical protein
MKSGVVFGALVVACIAWCVWPLGDPQGVREGALQNVQISVSADGGGYALVSLSGGWSALIPIRQLQTRSWVAGGQYTVAARRGLWPRGPKYWLVEQQPEKQQQTPEKKPAAKPAR